jgi:hypothetical protein
MEQLAHCDVDTRFTGDWSQRCGGSGHVRNITHFFLTDIVRKKHAFF